MGYPSRKEGIQRGPHREFDPIRGDWYEHPGYMWATCVRCGAEFEKGRWGPHDTCAHPECEKGELTNV
ncbi:MAG: hypothetical protein V3S82_04640 [Dehalococcoidia bacterium]